MIGYGAGAAQCRSLHAGACCGVIAGDGIFRGWGYELSPRALTATSGVIEDRVARLDWEAVRASLDDRGYATTPALLTAAECEDLIALYDRREVFRNRVVMERHGYGVGEYKYFAAPLPAIVASMRTAFYERLAPIGSDWMRALRLGEGFPAGLDEFLGICGRAGQIKPTPLLLRYEAGGYNCMHQDLYGEVFFPLQMTFVLSRREADFSGGEFLLTEQRPRAQSRGEAVTLDRGEAIVFATRWRPVRGARGYYRVNVRHGVSRLRTGRRVTLGIIFHDAK
jgi:hypothetical protein